MKINRDSFWKGEGLPIVFDGRNPVKNTLFFKRQTWNAGAPVTISGRQVCRTCFARGSSLG